MGRILLVLCLLLFNLKCQLLECQPQILDEPQEPLQQEKFYNLEPIDLGLPNLHLPSFFVNGRALVQEGSIYTSPDLLIYRSQSGGWQATFVGKGDIKADLEIRVGDEVIKRITLSNKAELVSYSDKLGIEWLGIYNVGNSCFANATYKFIARCEGFDAAINQDKTSDLSTSLRNIINGIRLGKRSAFQEAAISRRINNRLLDIISNHPNVPTDLKKNFNDKSGDNARAFLEAIYSLLYKRESLEKIEIQPDQINLYLEQGKNLPFQIVRKNKITRSPEGKFYIKVCEVYISLLNELTHWEADGAIDGWQSFLYQAPAFMVVDMTLGDLPPPTDGHYLRLQESQKIRIYNYQDDSYIGDKEYQLIGFTCGINGHCKSYIYFPKYGWYCHNDAVVSEEQFDKISIIHRPNAHATHSLQVLALYKLKA